MAQTRWIIVLPVEPDLTDPDDAEVGDFACEFCGRTPSIALRMRSTGGYVFFRSLSSTPMISLCKECGLGALQSGQRKSGVGLVTINPFAPYALAQNQKWLARLKKLPDPQGEVVQTEPFGRFKISATGPSSPSTVDHKCTVSRGGLSVQIQGPTIARTILPLELMKKIQLKRSLFTREKAIIMMEDGTVVTLKEADGNRTGSSHAFRLVRTIGPLLQEL